MYKSEILSTKIMPYSKRLFASLLAVVVALSCVALPSTPSGQPNQSAQVASAGEVAQPQSQYQTQLQKQYYTDEDTMSAQAIAVDSLNEFWIDDIYESSADKVISLTAGKTIKAYGKGRPGYLDGNILAKYVPIAYQVMGVKSVKTYEPDFDKMYAQYIVPSPGNGTMAQEMYKFKVAAPGSYVFSCLYAIATKAPGQTSWKLEYDASDELLYDGRFIPVKVLPKATTITKKAVGKKFVNLAWTKIAKVTNYQVQYRVKGTKKWTVKTITSKAASLKLTKLKSKKTYEVQVRSYAKVSGTKYVSPWSKVITTKKIK